MPLPPKNQREFKSLVEVVAALRGPNGCPWDKEQTHQTLTQYAIEEAHELAEAIDQNNQTEMVEELGDLLLQVVLHAEIAKQSGRFTLEDIVSGIVTKMVRRHPHVFSDTKVTGSDEVMENWAKIKAQEKAEKKKTDTSPFANIPRAMPALLRSQKIGSKTVRMNFDWENTAQVVAKVDEEIQELKEAIAADDKTAQMQELGDVLFSVVQLARHLDFDAEQALRQTNLKFEKRFAKMAELISQKNLDMSQMKIQELEQYWLEAKKIEKLKL